MTSGFHGSKMEPRTEGYRYSTKTGPRLHVWMVLFRGSKSDECCCVRHNLLLLGRACNTAQSLLPACLN